VNGLKSVAMLKSVKSFVDSSPSEAFHRFANGFLFLEFKCHNFTPHESPRRVSAALA
jgi:hypothetical protein